MNKAAAWKLIKKNSMLATIAAFGAAAFAMILIGVFAMHTPVVPMCVLVMIEAGIAVMLHRAEIWLHGVLVIAEIAAGVIAGRIGLVILCALVYVAATAALQILGKDE